MFLELQTLFIRDLKKLKEEINLYQKEVDIWKVPEGINNSAGNLCLHIVGNLNHFIGSVLFENGYVRDRTAEFNDKNIPVSELNKRINGTVHFFEEQFLTMEKGILNSTYPIEVFGHEMTTKFFLIHLSGHLNYHLGQINYHRRLIN